MNILIVTHLSPPAIDGGSKVVHRMGDYLVRHGHHITTISSDCCSTDDFVKPKPKTHSNGLPVYTFLHRPLKLFNFHLAKILQKGPLFKFIPLIRAIIKVLKFKPKLIIAGPLPTTIVLYAKFFQKITGAKLLINPSFHPTDPEFQNQIFRKILRSADHLWTLTDYETDYFQKLGISQTINLGCGVNSDFIIKHQNIKFPPTPNLLFIGSFSAHKGIKRLIETFRRLPPDITLTLAGQKTLFYPRIKHLLKHPRIKTFFRPSNLKIRKLIDNCTALVLPSNQESFGLVLIEAMARGKPVLVTPIPQLLELINKTKSGLIFNPKNTIHLLGHPQHFGLNGLRYVSAHYTWAKIGDRLCQKLSL